MENVLPKPREMDFNAPYLAVTKKKVAAEHGVLLNCNDQGKDRRRKVQCVSVFDWSARKRCVQHNPLGEGKKC